MGWVSVDHSKVRGSGPLVVVRMAIKLKFRNIPIDTDGYISSNKWRINVTWMSMAEAQV